jgi:hypothetical protein
MTDNDPTGQSISKAFEAAAQSFIDGWQSAMTKTIKTKPKKQKTEWMRLN